MIDRGTAGLKGDYTEAEKSWEFLLEKELLLFTGKIICSSDKINVIRFHIKIWDLIKFKMTFCFILKLIDVLMWLLLHQKIVM